MTQRMLTIGERTAIAAKALEEYDAKHPESKGLVAACVRQATNHDGSPVIWFEPVDADEGEE